MVSENGCSTQRCGSRGRSHAVGGLLNEREFDEFRHESVHWLTEINENCKNEFRISTWPRWDYDLDRGTLTFSEDGVPKVIATIQVVGSTSNSSNTWLWSWDNATMPEHVKDRVREVRAFGEKEGISGLTEACMPDDEYLGWEMTAISARLLGAKGAYRCPHTRGFVYVIYMGIGFACADQVAAKASASSETTACSAHGSGTNTFVCEHLVVNPKQKWFSSPPSTDKPWPDAWCAECDAVYQEQGEWNEENEGRLPIKLLCHHCYEALRNQDPSALQ